LSLYLQEIEKITGELQKNDLTDEEKNFLLYKLKILESYSKTMNDKVKDIIIENNYDF